MRNGRLTWPQAQGSSLSSTVPTYRFCKLLCTPRQLTCCVSTQKSQGQLVGTPALSTHSEKDKQKHNTEFLADLIQVRDNYPHNQTCSPPIQSVQGTLLQVPATGRQPACEVRRSAFSPSLQGRLCVDTVPAGLLACPACFLLQSVARLGKEP